MFSDTPRSSVRDRLSSTAVSRRSLLLTGGGLAATASLAGCSFFDTDPAQSGNGGGNAGPKGPEAPSLAAKVEAGDLPPVEERLPTNPLVVEPHAEIGQYGGTWRSAMITEEDRSWLTQGIAYEPLVRWIPDWTGQPGAGEVIPNLCETFEELDGGRGFQFTLREGIKWSDGEPLTGEDFRFCFEDVNTYEGLNPGGIYSLFANVAEPDTPGIFEMDGNTIRYLFDEPKPGFLEEIASNEMMVLPKHYFEQFHELYNDNIDEVIAEANLDDWVQLWESKNESFTDVDRPTLFPWKLTAAIGDGNYVTAVRNPYYWKVDPDGSQLPYVDEIRCEVVQDIEVELLKLTNGELDMQMHNFDTIRNLPVVSDNQESGDYRLFSVSPQGPNAMVIGFNQNLENDRLREVLSNKDFRIGLSYAINRQRIIDTVYAGQTIPWQCAPVEGHPAYDEELGTQFTEYSEEKANEALDRAGYTEKDGNGFRLAEGERIALTVLVPTTMPDHLDAFEMIKADWAAVGVEVNVTPLAETLYWERVEANQAELSTWTAGEFAIRAAQGMNHYYLPSNPRGASRYGHDWALWYRGESDKEPPEIIQHQLALFDEMRTTYDAEEATALAREILDITKDQFFYIGICTQPDGYGVVKNNFGTNVPDTIPGGVPYQPPGPTNPEQYFFSG